MSHRFSPAASSGLDRATAPLSGSAATWAEVGGTCEGTGGATAGVAPFFLSSFSFPRPALGQPSAPRPPAPAPRPHRGQNAGVGQQPEEAAAEGLPPRAGLVLGPHAAGRAAQLRAPRSRRRRARRARRRVRPRGPRLGRQTRDRRRLGRQAAVRGQSGGGGASGCVGGGRAQKGERGGGAAARHGGGVGRGREHGETSGTEGFPYRKGEPKRQKAGHKCTATHAAPPGLRARGAAMRAARAARAGPASCADARDTAAHTRPGDAAAPASHAISWQPPAPRRTTARAAGGVAAVGGRGTGYGGTRASPLLRRVVPTGRAAAAPSPPLPPPPRRPQRRGRVVFAPVGRCGER